MRCVRTLASPTHPTATESRHVCFRSVSCAQSDLRRLRTAAQPSLPRQRWWRTRSRHAATPVAGAVCSGGRRGGAGLQRPGPLAAGLGRAAAVGRLRVDRQRAGVARVGHPGTGTLVHGGCNHPARSSAGAQRPVSLATPSLLQRRAAGLYGLALGLGNAVSVAAIVVPVTWVFLHRIRIEEAALQRAFPVAYPAYAAQSRRLLPLVW